MSNNARKGQRNAHALALAAVLSMQAAVAAQEVEQEINQVEVTNNPQGGYLHDRDLQLDRKLGFNAAAFEDAFVYEPEAYEGDDQDNDAHSAASDEDQALSEQNPDHETIVELTNHVLPIVEFDWDEDGSEKHDRERLNEPALVGTIPLPIL